MGVPDKDAAELDWAAEFRAWGLLLLPVCASNFCRTAMNFTDTSVLGHYGTEYLSAAAVAGVWVQITQEISRTGPINALNTLCSTAKGAGKPELAQAWLQLGVAFALALSVPIGATWVFTGSIMRPIVGTDSAEEQRVNDYSRIMIGAMPALVMYACINNYLVCHAITLPQLGYLALAAGVNLGLNFLFVHGCGGWGGLGFEGSPLATVCSSWLLLLGVCFVWRRSPAWHAPVPLRECCTRSRVREYASQALPGAVTGLLEDGQLQAITTMAGRLSKADLATHSAFFQVLWVLSSLMWALTTATRVRMGHHLGAGSIAGARLVLRMAAVVGLGACSGVGLTIALLRGRVAHLFSSDPVVWGKAGDIAILVGSAYVALAAFYVSMAALAAMGRPGVVAASFFVGAWCVALPAAYVLAFEVERTKGLFGLWLGMSAGYGVTTACAVCAVLCTDWEQVLLDTRRRTEQRAALLGGASAGSCADSASDGPAGGGCSTNGSERPCLCPAIAVQ